MKKLFSFLCLLVLGMSMSVTNAMTPDKPSKVKLVQIDNATFKMVMVYNDRNATIKSITFSSATSLNGTHSINTTDNCNGDLLYYDMGWNQFSDPQGSVTFVMSGGTSNSDYRYSISMSGTITYSGSCGNNTVNEPFSASWSNVPVEVYESDEETPITLTDEALNTDEPTGYYDNLPYVFTPYFTPTYVKVQQTGDGNYNVLFFCEDCDYTTAMIGLKPVYFGSNDIRGTFSFNTENPQTNCDNSNFYFQYSRSQVDWDKYYWGDHLNGTILFSYTGETSSDGYPKFTIALHSKGYTVTPNGSSACRQVGFTYIGVLPVRAYDINNNPITLNLKNEYDIIVQANDANLGTGNGSGTYPRNSSQTISATAEEGYEFVQWNDGNTDNPRTIQVTEDKTYTATFEVIKPKYTITVTSANASQGSVSGGGTYREGSSTNISASGLNGYAFSQWDDGNTDNPRTITVTGNKTYTASFTLPGMTVGSCSDADISFHCGYSDVTVSRKLTVSDMNSYKELYYTDNNGNIYSSNTYLIKAQNSEQNSIRLYLSSRNVTSGKTYTGGECENISCIGTNTYELYLAKIMYQYNYCKNGYFDVPSAVTYSTVCYNNNHSESCYTDYGWDYYTDLYSKIEYNGTEYKLRGNKSLGGSIKVTENNAGGLFIETENVQNYDRNVNIYFTLGNRKEYETNLGTGTIDVTSSSITMSATDGNHSASIRLNNNTTGDKSLSDFNIANCHFTYDGNSITEVSDMTGNFTVTDGICTLSLKIRDCEQILYIVTMSAPAPVYNINYFDKDGAAFSGTQTNAPTTHTFGTATTLKSASKTGYDFGGWFTDENCTGSAITELGATAYTGSITLYANWTEQTYNIYYKDKGNVAYSGNNSGSLPTSHTYDVPTDLVDGTKDGFTFLGWFTDENCTVSAGSSIAANSITADITLYADWKERVTPEIELNDNITDISEYESILTTYAGQEVNVTLAGRTLAANRWHTLCLPFDYDTDGSALDGRVYELNDCTTDATNGMTITFYPAEYDTQREADIIAGRPYLVWIDQAVTTPLRFEGVTLTTFTPQTVSKTDVDFKANIPQQTLTDKADIFINNNRLYYPKTSGGSILRAFRAYFHIKNANGMSYAQPRVRIVAEGASGETMTVLETDIDAQAETRKYVEDGILIIERGGVRYDAQGKRMDK